jgi:hypothetical protein
MPERGSGVSEQIWTPGKQAAPPACQVGIGTNGELVGIVLMVQGVGQMQTMMTIEEAHAIHDRIGLEIAKAEAVRLQSKLSAPIGASELRITG